jgi:hypothetical protein
MIDDQYIYAGNGIRPLRVDRIHLAGCSRLQLLSLYLTIRATMDVLIVTNTKQISCLVEITSHTGSMPSAIM